MGFFLLGISVSLNPSFLISVGHIVRTGIQVIGQRFGAILASFKGNEFY